MPPKSAANNTIPARPQLDRWTAVVFGNSTNDEKIKEYLQISSKQLEALKVDVR